MKFPLAVVLAFAGSIATAQAVQIRYQFVVEEAPYVEDLRAEITFSGPGPTVR